MGLTSGALLWLEITAATACVLGTALAWPRLARQRTGQIAARVGLILACQATVLAAATTYVNDTFGFFASWSAMLGNSSTRYPQAPPPAAVAAVDHARPITITGISDGTLFRGDSALRQAAGGLAAGTTPSALGLRAPNGIARVAASSGAVLRVTIHGEYTGITAANDYVYLPPQYFQPGYAGARFPVIMTFTGYPNDPLNLMRLLKLPATVSRLTAAGHLQPAIYLMLNPSVALPQDTECTNIPAGLQVATFFGRDVPLAVEQAFHTQTTRSGWSTLGYSTGAYCATKMAMLYPGQFSAAVAMSGYFVALKDHTTGNIYGGSPAYRNENNLDWRLTHLPAPPVSVLVASSASGEPSLPGSLVFLHLVRPPMHGYSLILPQGGHNYHTWRRELPQSLEWLSSRLAPALLRLPGGGGPAGSKPGR
ncbi:MAG TPA: alpha/beta hydrolase-fold protein [Streptosporangiaceae bacterium]|nr:alpha/beta hydrolase-fold protein [Streptosporangiaceae bacterium]